MKELITIVIPTYKRSEMLERAIDSCLKQSYKNIEIIIVDDNNPDTEYRKDTEKFMKKYKDNSKIRYIKMKQNGGGSAARNFGIENKLDDSGRNVVWQSMKYAGYCSSLKKDDIKEIFQQYLIQKGYQLDILGICWMQGESDAVNIRTADRYEDNTLNKYFNEE